MYYYVLVITYFVMDVGPPYFIEYFLVEKIYFFNVPPQAASYKF
jgi:hypothetical protein